MEINVRLEESDEFQRKRALWAIAKAIYDRFNNVPAKAEKCVYLRNQKLEISSVKMLQ